MSAYNFGDSGHNLTKLYQGTYHEAWVINCTLILQEVPSTKFGRAKMSKIRHEFWQLSTLIASISETHRHVENLNSTWSTTFRPLLGETNLVNFGPLTKKLYTLMLIYPTGLFSGDYSSALRRCFPQIFTHITTPKMYFKSDVGRRAASCWALPHISSFFFIFSFWLRVLD